MSKYPDAQRPLIRTVVRLEMEKALKTNLNSGEEKSLDRSLDDVFKITTQLTEAKTKLSNKKDQIDELTKIVEKLQVELKKIKCNNRDKLWRIANPMENLFEKESIYPQVVISPNECKGCSEYTKCLEQHQKELENKRKES